jgi:hypothetical protein
MTPLDFRGAQFVLLAFALDDTQVFNEIVDWNNVVNEPIRGAVNTMNGNKCDLPV